MMFGRGFCLAWGIDDGEDQRRDCYFSRAARSSSAGRRERLFATRRTLWGTPALSEQPQVLAMVERVDRTAEQPVTLGGYSRDSLRPCLRRDRRREG